VIKIDDLASPAELTLTSTALTPDEGSGTYTGIDPDGNPIPAGTWMIYKK
jgi:hypothetical protein